MDSQKQVLVEQILFTAISAFHDLNDRDKIEKYARDYFSGFCQRYDVDMKEAYKILDEMFEHRRKHTVFDYEYYKGEGLGQILFGKTKDQEISAKLKGEKTNDER